MIPQYDGGEMTWPEFYYKCLGIEHCGPPPEFTFLGHIEIIIPVDDCQPGVGETK